MRHPTILVLLAVLLVLAVVAVLSLRETFGMSLSYVEE